MKKFLLALSLIIVLIPVFAGAMTLAQLRIQINKIEQQISSLTSKIQANKLLGAVVTLPAPPTIASATYSPDNGQLVIVGQRINHTNLYIDNTFFSDSAKVISWSGSQITIKYSLSADKHFVFAQGYDANLNLGKSNTVQVNMTNPASLAKAGTPTISSVTISGLTTDEFNKSAWVARTNKTVSWTGSGLGTSAGDQAGKVAIYLCYPGSTSVCVLGNNNGVLNQVSSNSSTGGSLSMAFGDPLNKNYATFGQYFDSQGRTSLRICPQPIVSIPVPLSSSACQSSGTFRLVSAASFPGVTVGGLTSGGTWDQSVTRKISWNSTELSSDSRLEIVVCPPSLADSYSSSYCRALTLSNVGLYSSGASATGGYANASLPSDLSSSQYFLAFCKEGTARRVCNPANFTFTASVSTPTPAITAVSPATIVSEMQNLTFTGSGF
ncbi:MAG: hypothetical protein WC640_04020, partial [Candidatus Paceibacterota bacterium]